ncbi:MAG: hypothetical protein JRK53_15360 [Deltaproteobacteria bacterium]|nr:hypothetical protein [Deltaproteobacteria bacterium]
MHFMPEDEGYEEKLWPDGYKAVIKNRLRAVIASELRSEDTLQNVYEQQYADQFPDLDRFIERITEMLVVGAEKGGDEAFDDIVTAFLYEYPLPEPRVYARYLLLPKLPEEVSRQLMQQVIDEYRQDEVFIHAFQVGYGDLYENFEQFLNESARLAAVRVVNGMDDMLTAIYRAFATGGPLPPARRNAKRVKNWFVPKGSQIRDVPLSRRAKQKRRRENSDAENSDLR